MIEKITPKEYAQIDKIVADAIAKGYDHAKADWRGMALGVLLEVCKTEETFTANDLSKEIMKSPIKTHDNRAIGGVIKTGQGLGWLKPTGNRTPSYFGHKVAIQVWESLLYKKPATEGTLF